MNALFRSPLVVILGEINRLNPTWPIKVTPEMVEVVNPVLFLGPGGVTNTRATMRVRPESLAVQYFSGSTLVYYNRRGFGRVFKGLVIPGASTDYANSREAAVALAERHHIPFDPTDCTLIAITNPTQVTLTASSGSIAYNGSITVPFEIVP